LAIRPSSLFRYEEYFKSVEHALPPESRHFPFRVTESGFDTFALVLWNVYGSFTKKTENPQIFHAVNWLQDSILHA
jgi:hypothetical protein